MKLHTYSLLFVWFFTLTTQAQTDWLQKPLEFIPAGNVMVWAYDGLDFRQMAQKAAPGVKEAHISATAPVWNQKEKVADTWKTLQPELNVVGGGGNEFSEPQGIPAMMGVAANAYMWLMTAHARHADFIERSLYNAAMRTVNDTAFAHQPKEVRGAAEVLMAVPGFMYAKDEEEQNLYVNFYTNSTSKVTLQEEKLTLDQITSMPTDGRIKIRLIKDKSPLKLRVHLRIPDWAVQRQTVGNVYQFVGKKPEAYRVFVNGHEIDQPLPDAKGYLVIDREWQSEDEIYLDFPLSPQYLRQADREKHVPVRGQVAMQVGPTVYAVTTPTAGCYFSTNTMPGFTGKTSDAGNELLVGKMFRYEGTPQDAMAPEVEYEALPYAEGTAGIVWCKEIK